MRRVIRKVTFRGQYPQCMPMAWSTDSSGNIFNDWRACAWSVKNPLLDLFKPIMIGVQNFARMGNVDGRLGLKLAGISIELARRIR